MQFWTKEPVHALTGTRLNDILHVQAVDGGWVWTTSLDTVVEYVGGIVRIGEPINKIITSRTSRIRTSGQLSDYVNRDKQIISLKMDSGINSSLFIFYHLKIRSEADVHGWTHEWENK